MKNLVLSALLFAGLTQAAGCIIVADDTSGTGEGDVSVAWTLLSSSPNGTPIASACPAGADTIQILAQRGTDQPFTDKFLCNATGGGIADRLPVGQYAVWIQITNTQGTIKFAESGARIVDVVDSATTPITIDIFTDRAFFQASWNLTQGSTITCAQAGAGKMSVLATVTGGANGFDDDQTNCVDGEGGKTAFTTLPVPIGTYTVVVAALNAIGESIGDSAPLTNRPLDYGNKFEDLGTVNIPLR